MSPVPVSELAVRIPPEWMQTNRDHRVSAVRRSAGGAAGGAGHSRTVSGGGVLLGAGGPLSKLAVAKMVRDIGIGAAPHMFRSSFRDWAAECSDAPREVCELALAHVNTNAIEAAYRRTDLFERRPALMEQWAAFLAGTEDKVAPRSGQAA